MKKFICMALLFLIMTVFIQLRSTIIVNAQYKEMVLGKISNDKGYIGTEYIVGDTYDEKSSGTGFLLCNYTTNKENNDESRIIYYEIKEKK